MQGDRFIGGRFEIMEEAQVETRTTPSPPAVVEDMLFVALGKDVKEGETVLMWSLRNSRGRRICILHVHQPAQKMPTMGTKISISRVEEERQVKAYHENERKAMLETLDKYIQTCKRAGVQAEKLYVEMDSIEKGIVKLISEHGIKWLVVGASSCTRKTKEPIFKKAIHVRAEAPVFCHIFFIGKGFHIHTRGNLGRGNIEAEPSTPQANSNTVNRLFLRSGLFDEGQMCQTNSRVSAHDYRRIRSDNHVIQLFDEVLSTPSNLDAQGNIDRELHSRRSTSSTSHLLTGSRSELTLGLDSAQSPGSVESEIQIESPMLQQNESNHRHHYSVPSSAIEENMNDQHYERLAQFMAEAVNSHREVYEESIRRKKAEKDVICRVKASEIMYAKELRRRKENEEALARGYEEFEKIKRQLNEIDEEFRVAQEYKSLIERQISGSDKRVEELEQKMFSAVELLKKYKNEIDELQAEHDNALRVADELRKKQADEASSSSMSQFFSEFSFLEIEEATSNFGEHLKIGDGGYGSIFKGYLRYTQVAIKMLHPNSRQGPSKFQQEVNMLSTLRHPNLVTLIGACHEAWALIYEYLPNGSLEDRLNCKDNTPPLSWKTRIRIAAELCSALIFLHSRRPQGIVHGGLKPSNILFDSNFTSKLSLSQDDFLGSNSTQCCRTEPKGTLVYMDPEFLSTGELTSKSDVFSFGIILLRLLTGRPALGITKEVQYALDNGNLKDLLDPTAGDWPFVQAKQLANLALRCSDVNRKNRPDLASEVWRVLESMRVSCGVSSLTFGSGEHFQVPSYFVCPIFQEIMQNPVVAADGFTYEAEAMKGWLDSGHDTSPMTNLQLPHSNLVPNHALRSAIQEWLQHP